MVERNLRKTRTGLVTSNKMDKTVVVRIERKVSHPLYQKYIRRTSKLQAHDENNGCNEGDLVMIEQCRQISKNKSWRLVKILERAAD